jgi:fructose transport system substrate-binding protein
MRKSLITAAMSALALGAVFAAPAHAEGVSACLITKTDTNPFFVKMKARPPRPPSSEWI